MSVVDLTRGRSRSRTSMSSRSRRRARSSSSSLSSMASSRSSSSRVPRYVPLKGIHKFSRNISINFTLNQLTGFIDAGGVTVGQSLAFTYTLNGVVVKGTGIYNQRTDMPSVSDFTNLFDNYRIDGVAITMISGVTGVGVQATNSHMMPWFWIFNDQDDGLAPTNDQCMQREGLRILSFSDTNVKTHRCSPRLATQHYNGIALSGYGIGSKYAYVDCAYPNVEYYSTKLFCPQANNTTNYLVGTFQFVFKYDMTFKGVI